MGKLKLLLIVLVFVLLGLGVFAGSLYIGSKYFQRPSSNSTTAQNITQPSSQSQQFVGVVACLPIKPGDTYQDADGCALGLKTSDGKYWILQGSSVTPDTLAEGNKLQVTGSIDSGNISVHYDVAGFIKVTNISKL